MNKDGKGVRAGDDVLICRWTLCNTSVRAKNAQPTQTFGAATAMLTHGSSTWSRPGNRHAACPFKPIADSTNTTRAPRNKATAPLRPINTSTSPPRPGAPTRVPPHLADGLIPSVKTAPTFAAVPRWERFVVLLVRCTNALSSPGPFFVLFSFAAASAALVQSVANVEVGVVHHAAAVLGCSRGCCRVRLLGCRSTFVGAW